MRPLIDGYAPGSPLASREGRVLRSGAFVAQARALAARLPEGGCGLLLCEDRLAFVLGFAAMLLQRATALLPPSHAPRALANIARTRAAAYALVDRRGAVATTPEIVVDPRSDADGDEGVPSIEDGQLAAIVYTSGTTGDPMPHPKTWSSLVLGAAALRERIGFAHGDALVGAVPPQHMWGLEATVMLPLQSGGLLDSRVPLLPDDIAAALVAMPSRRWLVVTPLHARSCVRAGVSLPPLAGTLSATTPLDPELARAFERLTGAPAIEIYGSTETGVIATREPARDPRFTPLACIAATMTDSGLAVRGGHVGATVTLSDRATVSSDGRFTLAGRDADLVKVGGKRASIAMLDRELASIAGVVDGAFVVVDGSALTPRLAALAVAPGGARETILAALRERIDPVFLPRPLHLVDMLPRNALGKLSAETLRQRVAELSASAAPAASERLPLRPLARQCSVPASHAALAGHFPGHPIVPAAWLLTLVEVACREAFGAARRICGIVHARFRAPLAPDTLLAIELEQREDGSIAFRCLSGTTRLADGVLATTERP